MLSASNTLTSNLRSINDQINVVSNLLLDAVEEISDPGSKNIFEDESENLTAQNEGKIEAAPPRHRGSRHECGRHRGYHGGGEHP